MPKEIKLPQWGMNMNDGTVIKWLKSIGDDVKKGDELVEIESTKVNAAVEASESGKLGRIDIQEGALVPVGTVLGLILNEGEKIEDFPSSVKNNKEETHVMNLSGFKDPLTGKRGDLFIRFKLDLEKHNLIGEEDKKLVEVLFGE